MAAIDTILTQQEAAMLSELGASFPLCSLTDISQVEEDLFRSCLGWELYKKMKAAKADYSAATKWAAGVTVSGTVVKHGGTYWKALQDTTVEPLAESVYWALAPKFDTAMPCGELYNTFFCNYLGRYIALNVAALTVPRVAVKATALGVVRNAADGSIPADIKEIEMLSKAIKAQAEQTYRNMNFWLEENGGDCFDSGAECAPCENAHTCGSAGNCSTTRKGFLIA